MKTHNYGQYLCRIEIGNSAHRLEMTAWIFGTPIEATDSGLLSCILLVLGAVLLVLFILFLIQFAARFVLVQQNRQKKLKEIYAGDGFRIRGV